MVHVHSVDRLIGVPATAGAIIRLAVIVNATTWRSPPVSLLLNPHTHRLGCRLSLWQRTPARFLRSPSAGEMSLSGLRL